MSATKIYARVRTYGDKILPHKAQVIQKVKKASWWEIAAHYQALKNPDQLLGTKALLA